jgi:hypothetical protein
MDTNQETGVSVADVAGLLDDETEQPVEELEQEASTEEVAVSDEPEVQAESEGEDEVEEVEFEGKVFKGPKGVKEALLRQADYTKKTQEVAEQRKAVEERAQALEQQQRVMAQTFDKAVEFREVQKRLTEYENLDWAALGQNDPAQALQLNLAYQKLQRDAQAKYGEWKQAEQQTQQLTEQNRQQMLVKAEQELKTRLPNYGPQVAEKIVKAGKEYGITDQELNSLIDPRYVHVLHDAMKWRALQAEKPKAMQKVVDAPQAIKPQATQPKPRTNQAALDRLKQNGRIEDFAKFL